MVDARCIDCEVEEVDDILSRLDQEKYYLERHTECQLNAQAQKKY